MKLSLSASIQFGVSSKRRTSQSKACAVSDDSGGAQSLALTAFATLTSSCASAVTFVNQNPLGPYGDSGSCSYDCGFMEQNWNWSANWVPSVNNGILIPAVGNLNIAPSYNVSFQPAQIWVSADLVNYTTSLTGALATIGQVDAAIINAGGLETPAQAAQLATAFATAGTTLQNNLAEVNGALQRIAGFLNWEQQWIGFIQAQAASAQSSITTGATNAENNLIGDIACGDGDVRNSFNGMLADVAAKFAAMQTPFNTVNSNFQAALNAGAVVAGAFLPLQSDNQLVGEYLASAQSYAPTSPLRQMKLNMAGSVWAELVADANAQLGTSS